MFTKLLHHLWAARDQFIRYFVIGLGALALDLATLFLLKEYVHVSPVIAVIINQIIVLNYVFFLNKYWSFKASGLTHQQMMRFALVAFGNYLISVSWMWLFTRHWHLGFIRPERYYYLLVRLANIALSVAWNFIIYKQWVYTGTTQLKNPENIGVSAQNGGVGNHLT